MALPWQRLEAERKRFFAVLLIGSLFLISCGRAWTWADYKAIHKDGIQKLEAARQINARFKEVDHFIAHFGFGKQPMEWQTVAFIDGRFELTYVQPITVDYSARTVSPAGNPRFLLNAAKSVTVVNGRAETRYDAKLQRAFGMAEWKQFVQSEFDLTVLGIPADEIHGIPLWSEHVHGWRRDRVRIE